LLHLVGDLFELYCDDAQDLQTLNRLRCLCSVFVNMQSQY